jgi:monofunctional biosynthetic peptidoglycan transglycosylase
MGKSSRGRRAVAEQLGLLDEQGQSGQTSPGRSSGASGRRTAPRRDTGGRPPAKRSGKLPSDTTILGVMIGRILRWAIRLVAFFFLASVALVLIYKVVDPPLTPLMLIRPFEELGHGDLVGVSKQWVDIEDINPALLRSVIAAEDGRFFTHNGIDWKAVDQAQKRNERSDGKKLYGASTITMQCARNVFLWQGRNYVRKGLEVYFTYLMEFLWSKKRILEVYVNVIEWGDGVYGVEAASQKYFGIPASKLSSRQAALLAAVLPNPRAWSPAQPTSYISRRASMILARANGVGLGPIRDSGESNSSSKKKNEE